jgi:hypothetical protein
MCKLYPIQGELWGRNFLLANKNFLKKSNIESVTKIYLVKNA